MTCNEWSCKDNKATSGLAIAPSEKEQADKTTVSALDAQFAQQQNQLVDELQKEKQLLSMDPNDPAAVEAEIDPAT